MRDKSGEKGGVSKGEVPLIHRMFGFNWAKHVHLGRKQKYGRSHEGSVYLGCSI